MYISPNYLLRAIPSKFDACQSLPQSLFLEDTKLNIPIYLFIQGDLNQNKTKCKKKQTESNTFALQIEFSTQEEFPGVCTVPEGKIFGEGDTFRRTLNNTHGLLF